MKFKYEAENLMVYYWSFIQNYMSSLYQFKSYWMSKENALNYVRLIPKNGQGSRLGSFQGIILSNFGKIWKYNSGNIGLIFESGMTLERFRRITEKSQ